jgi:hypothetical protein
VCSILYIYLIIAYAIWWTDLLWHAIHKSFVWGFEHVESRCGHVSMVLSGHSVQVEFGYKSGQNIFLCWLPMYWAYRNFRVCVTWTFVILGIPKIG